MDVQATGQVKLQGGGLYGVCDGVAVTAAGDVDLLLGMLQGPSIALTSTTASITVDSSFVMVEPPPQGPSSSCGSASVSATPGGFVMNAPKGTKTSTDMVVSMSDKTSDRGSRVWRLLPMQPSRTRVCGRNYCSSSSRTRGQRLKADETPDERPEARDQRLNSDERPEARGQGQRREAETERPAVIARAVSHVSFLVRRIFPRPLAYGLSLQLASSSGLSPPLASKATTS